MKLTGAWYMNSLHRSDKSTYTYTTFTGVDCLLEHVYFFNVHDGKQYKNDEDF